MDTFSNKKDKYNNIGLRYICYFTITFGNNSHIQAAVITATM